MFFRRTAGLTVTLIDTASLKRRVVTDAEGISVQRCHLPGEAVLVKQHSHVSHDLGLLLAVVSVGPIPLGRCWGNTGLEKIEPPRAVWDPGSLVRISEVISAADAFFRQWLGGAYGADDAPSAE